MYWTSRFGGQGRLYFLIILMYLQIHFLLNHHISTMILCDFVRWMCILCLLPQLSYAFKPRAGAGLGHDPVMKAGPWGFHSFTLASVPQKCCLDKLTWTCQLNLEYFKYMLISANLPPFHFRGKEKDRQNNKCKIINKISPWDFI